MKSFDAHSDIFTHIGIKRLEGERDIFRRYHFDRLNKGNVGSGIFVIWVDPPYTVNPMRRTMQIIGAAVEEIDDMKDCAGIVYRYSDLKEIEDSGRFAVVMGMEGLSGFEGNPSLVTMAYKLGVRHAMLTWNEENEFATGVRSSNKDRGVTPAGVEVLKRMESLGMIVDVSHANEKTFWDIYENTQKPFIASHSNVYNLCGSARNLKDEQIKAIAERGGVIGMNAWPDFIDEKDPTIENLANHIDYIAELVGIDTIGFGFDFCDFLSGDTTSSFQDGESTAAIGLEDATKVPKLIEILEKRGYKEKDIEKIARGNFERVLKEILK